MESNIRYVVVMINVGQAEGETNIVDHKHKRLIKKTYVR